VIASDGDLSTSLKFTWNVANPAPDALDDTVSTDEDTDIILSISDIVTPNDTDLDGDTLVITAVSNPSNGSVVLNSDGTVAFTRTQTSTALPPLIIHQRWRWRHRHRYGDGQRRLGQ